MHVGKLVWSYIGFCQVFALFSVLFSLRKKQSLQAVYSSRSHLKLGVMFVIYLHIVYEIEFLQSDLVHEWILGLYMENNALDSCARNSRFFASFSTGPIGVFLYPTSFFVGLSFVPIFPIPILYLSLLDEPKNEACIENPNFSPPSRCSAFRPTRNAYFPALASRIILCIVVYNLVYYYSY